MQDIIEKINTTPEKQRDLYQKFSREEQTARTAYHYSQNPKFFNTITAGKWHAYSGVIWDNVNSLTEAQEKKFDLIAEKMNIKEGDRILEVGCGWGGALVYLCEKYKVSGVGVTISPQQLNYCEQRACEHQADVEIRLQHWEDIPEDKKFDAIYTDEVVVHFENLTEYYAKCKKLLKPGGRVVNKELHFTHSKYTHAKDNLSQRLNAMYGFTGNYRTLCEELSFIDSAELHLESISEIPIHDYWVTVNDYWLASIEKNKQYLEHLSSPKHVRDFKLYLRGYLILFKKGIFKMHVLSAINSTN